MPIAAEEGTATIAPALPIEAKRLGLKADTKGSLEFPKEHWSAGMTPGDLKIVNGVIFEHLPKARKIVVVAGVPENEQPAFSLVPPDDDADAGSAPIDPKKTASWLASYFGKDLTPAKKTSLANTYIQLAED